VSYRPRTDVPRLIAHRGASAVAPENTIAAFEAAKRLGASWVEFDAMLCADGTPVVIHDETLRRTTGTDGWVAETSLADMQRLDAGRWFSEEFAGARIPTLADALEALGRLGLGANVEIKPATGHEERTGKVVARHLARDWPASLPPPVVSSFAVPALRAAHAEAPGLDYAPLLEMIPDDWRAHLDAVGAQALHCNARRLTEGRVREVTGAGAAVRCYTVNDARQAKRLFARGVASLFSDRPDLLPAVA
jgi:glycerophosphoryl diester phosphodiesterase